MAYFKQWLSTARQDPTLVGESLLELARRFGVPLPPLPEASLDLYLKLYVRTSHLSEHLLQDPEHTVWLRFIRARRGASTSLLPTPCLLRLARLRQGAATLSVLSELLSQLVGSSVVVHLRYLPFVSECLDAQSLWALGSPAMRLGINTGLGQTVTSRCQPILIELGYRVGDYQQASQYLALCQALVQAYLGRSWRWQFRVYCCDPTPWCLGTRSAPLSLCHLGASSCEFDG